MLETAKTLARARNVWIAATLFGVFGLSAYFSDYYTLNVLIQSVTMMVSAAVLVAYGRWGIEALLLNPISRDYQLLLGINIAWLGTFLRSAFIIWWRVGPHGEAPIASDWVTFFNAMIMLGGVLHITAPGVIENKVPPRNWLLLGAAVGAGLTIGWLLLAVQIPVD